MHAILVDYEYFFKNTYFLCLCIKMMNEIHQFDILFHFTEESVIINYKMLFKDFSKNVIWNS